MTASTPATRKINLSKAPAKEAVMSVSHQLLVEKATREEAVKLSDFARRPLYWGNECLGGHYNQG